MVSDTNAERKHPCATAVSIRFEVRGGFRPRFRDRVKKFISFQSALRFAVVSDEWVGYVGLTVTVSIRFEVRGGFRPYPLTRRPDKPCCGGFTHHPSSPPPTSGQNLS